MTVRPKELADGLRNALKAGEPKGKQPEPVDGILIDTTGPAVRVYGASRHLMGIHTIPVIGSTGGGGSVCLRAEVADQLRATLMKVKGGTKAVCTLHLYEDPTQVEFDGVTGWANLVVTDGDQIIGVGVEHDPDGRFDMVWELIDQLVDAPADEGSPAMMAIGVETMRKLIGLKNDGLVVDLGTGTLDGRVLRFKVGTGFTGVVGLVDRLGYAKGGPSGDGPGRPEHLF